MARIVRKMTADISGFGGGYEDQCQRMLWRGVQWLAEVRPPVEMWDGAKAYANIYGVLMTEGKDLKALETYIIRKGDDCTGAMHQAVMGHLAYIHKHGEAGWLAEMRKHRTDPGEIYEWEGDLFPEPYRP